MRDAVRLGDWPDLAGLRFGASIGVAVGWVPAHDREAAGELYRSADRALYAQKADRAVVTTR